MHAIFFGAKRAFHATLRLTRRDLRGLGMTAARFDLMYMLGGRVARGSTYSMRQSTIWRELGVSPPVVSRMLGSLEKLGWVRRERESTDKRQRRVTLTEAGRLRIRAAMRRFVDSGCVQLALDVAVGGERWMNADACFWAMCEFDGWLGRVRAAFGDTAGLAYRWHPDD